MLAGSCVVSAPYALGGVLNEWSIPSLRTSIVAGAANNKLLTAEDHKRHSRAEIFYCPDNRINAGGIVEVYQRRHSSGYR